jgi:23S rRNA (guanosine2251-2'-O)-methyltransferase
MRKLRLEELGRHTPESYLNQGKIPVTVILDSIRSALNVGSVFRTADAFAIEQIVLCGITATPPNREITKTAIGATSTVNWEYSENVCSAIQKLKKEGYTIMGVEQTDASVSILNDFPCYPKTAVVFGNEVEGISDEAINLLDCCIEIPQFGTKHSLNVSVCAGIVLWELLRIHQSKI